VGWLVAVIVAPLLFVIVAVYTVVKLAALLLRMVFAPLALRRR